jgi:hypothetical protein
MSGSNGKKRRWGWIASNTLLMLFLLTCSRAGAQTSPSPTPSFTNSPSSTFTPTPTSSFTPTVNIAVTNTNTVDPWATDTPTPSWTPTIDIFATPTYTFTWDPFATDTWTPTPTNTPFGAVGSPVDTGTFTNTPTVTNTGTIFPTNTFTPTQTNTPSISRGSLALMPTAYSNAWDRWDGINWDISFSYFIGSIAAKDNTSDSTDYLEPLRVWLLTSDLKYAWLDENGDMPAVASGLLSTLLLSGGNPGATGTGNNSFTLTGGTLGGVYTVMSEYIAKDTAVHFGLVQGFSDLFDSMGIGQLAPNMNYGDLLPQLNSKLSASYPSTSRTTERMFYTGWNWRLLGTNWKFEILKPFPESENPILFNSQIDGLFAFNLGYEKWDHGYAVLGYFNFRFTIIPAPPPY